MNRNQTLLRQGNAPHDAVGLSFLEPESLVRLDRIASQPCEPYQASTRLYGFCSITRRHLDDNLCFILRAGTRCLCFWAKRNPTQRSK